MNVKISDKTKARLLSLVIFAIAAGILIALFGDITKLSHGFTESRPVISSEPLLLSGLLLFPMAVAIGAVLWLPRTADLTRAQVAEYTRRYSKLGKFFVGLLLVCIVGAIVAPFPQYWVVNHFALERGYVPCPKPNWPRRQNDRWALPGPHSSTERCPGEGTDPNL